MAAAMVRQHTGPRFRSGRFRGRQGSGEENVQLDFTKDPALNVTEILSYVIKQHAFSKAKKLGYLNAFVKLISKCGNVSKLGIPLKDILICLSVNLFQSPKEVRAGTLRVIKHLINTEESLQQLLDLHFDYYIVRSLDLCLDNEIERIHAQKLIRKLVSCVPKKLPKSLIFPLVAIGNDGTSERDRMVRASLACLCELTYNNPDIVAQCGGISMLLRKILDCHQYPRINESIVSTVLCLVNHPSTRHFIRFNTDLEQLIAPFTDCHFSYTGEASDSTPEDRESRFAASRMAVITVMRSWPGIIRFCRPDGTGLQSLVGILYLPFNDIRQAIVELVFELFRLPMPDWTADFTEALISTDPSRMVDDWRLTDGFVANEGKVLLPHTASVRPNLVDNHLALLLAAWIGAGILDALVEVIITTEDELFNRSVILLGELLHLASQLLPPECCHHSHFLPSLMALASSFDVPNSQRNQASLAVSHLERIHELKKRGPIPCSLFLDHLIKQSGSYKERPVTLNTQKNKMLAFHVRQRASSSEEMCMHYYMSLIAIVETFFLSDRASSSEEMCMQILKDTQVLNTKEHKNWDWDLIEYVLKWPDDKLRKLEEQLHVRFIKRLLYFYKPTNHLFSRVDGGHELGQKYAAVGCQLSDFLLRCEQDEGVKILTDYLTDIALCLSEVAIQRIAPESVMSPLNIINTLSHFYFLFIGRFSLTGRGDRFIERSGIYQHLLDIVSTAPQDSYVKLITSSLHYARDGNCRAVLSKALCASSESGRLYSTKLMRVLLRAKIQSFQMWGMEMLIGQLYDQSRSVAMTALSILDEACEVKENLEALVKMKPSFLHLGEKGVMILCRYMSIPKGFKFLTEANYTMNELKKWHNVFNTQYVGVVEEILNEALTTYEKTYEGSYTRRSSKRRQKKDAYIPTHLYGQLVQHKEGFELLRQQTYLEDYFHCVRCQELKSDEDVLKLKTALWAVGHIGLSCWGISWLQEEKIIAEIIRLAEESGIYSLRGTAFYILGMMSSTREGSEVLSQYGWESRWNTRIERWPVVEDRSSLLEDSMSEAKSLAAAPMGGAKFEMNSPGILDYIVEEHFSMSASGTRSDNRGDGDFNASEDDCDKESGINIDIGAKSGSSIVPRAKSRTLPLDDSGVRRYQTLPSKSFRSASLHFPSKDQIKTRSVEHIARSVSGSASSRIEPVGRSHSMKWEITSRTVANTQVSASSSSSVIPNQAVKVQCESTVVSQSNQVRLDSEDSVQHIQTSPSLVVDADQEEESSSSQETGTVAVTIGSPNEGESSDTAQGDLETSIESRNDETSVESTTDQHDDCSKNNGNSAVSITINVTDSDQNQSNEPTVIQIDDSDTSDNVTDVGQSIDSSKQTNIDEDSVSNEEQSDKLQKRFERSDSKEGFVRKISSVGKGERSSSSESSTRTSKSRTNSFNTDSVTSGLGSYDSGHQGVVEMPSLSPIASQNSLDLSEVQLRPKDKRETRDFIHPSSAFRRLSNLTRVPSIKRQSSPGMLGSSKYFDFSESAISYTTARDAIGYATLRSLMKYRTLSSDLDSDYGLNSLYDNMGSVSSLNRRPSIDSTEISRSRPTSLLRNFSGISLSEMDTSGIAQTPKASLYKQRPHTGAAEFMGIALPVDINMIFEVHEGEDKRSESFLGAGLSRQSTVMADSADTRSERSDSGHDSFRLDSAGRVSRSRTMSSSDFMQTPLSSDHNKEMCLQCHTGRRQETVTSADTDGNTLDKTELGSKVHRSSIRDRASSITEAVTETSGSLTSTASDSSGPKKLTLETTMGRTLVRKEMIRFVINLSSSVGVKGAEQGLLSLKQKFPKAFQDLCFFSEVSQLLGTCSFRLSARRFIQELFDDVNITKIVEEARSILGVDDVSDKSVMDTSLPEDFDGFEGFS